MSFRDDSLPIISFDDPVITHEEGGYTNFTISLSQPITGSITVDYRTLPGSAISGGDYSNSSGTVTFDSSHQTQTISIYTWPDSTGEPDESYFLELFNPKGGSFGDQNHSLRATGWILDDDAGGGQRALAVAGPVVAEESAGTATFTVSLSQAFTQDTTLNYGTVAGSAVAGKDFTAKTGSITFAAGQTEATVAVGLLNDGLSEGSETFGLKVTGANLAAVGQATVVDGDSRLPVASIDAIRAEEGGYLNFTVRLSKPSSSDVTLDYGTASGSALQDSDFSGAVGKVSFAAGETVAQVAIYMRADSLSESDESFLVKLSNPVGASFAPGDAAPAAIGWILDDDPGGEKRALTVVGNSATESAEGHAGKAVFTVAVSRALDHDITLNYATQDGSAKAGSDYVAKSGTVTLSAGATEATVLVDLVNSTDSERPETFRLKLSNVPTDDFGAGAVTSSGTATILDGTTRGTGGNDALSGTALADRIEGGGGADTIHGGGGADRLYGDSGSDRLFGDDGGDRIYGNSGDDRLYGKNGNDRLYGGSGDDRLSGAEGNDRLQGGTGQDRLYGGAGDDTFVFASAGEAGRGAARDRIYDFDRSDDVIDLHRIDANSGRNGNQAFKFIGTDAFDHHAGELRFNGTQVSGDTNGDGHADFSFTVLDVAKLTAGDFIL